MNFPDLETCKIIGPDFPDSEYAYYDGPYNEPTILKKDPSIVWKFLANAPTCEELGVWLHERLYRVSYWPENPYDGHDFVLESATSQSPDVWDILVELFEKTETQARAEAVKIILKAKG